MNVEYETKVWSSDTPELFQEAVAAAVDWLRRGEVVALPTETVYGLAANGLDADAVRRIFEVKGRPTNNPLILHVESTSRAAELTTDWSPQAAALAKAFWPGPLTLVLPRRSIVPDEVTAGGSTVAIRWPSHPLMQTVIRECGFPLAAPSANRSGDISPTQSDHVLTALAGKIPAIIDGGQSQVGIESTVVDLTQRPARVLRPGVITASALTSVLGDPVAGKEEWHLEETETGPLASPGQLRKHYAPQSRLVLWAWHDERELIEQLRLAGVEPSQAAIISHSCIPMGETFRRVSVMPMDPEAFARAIYGELHKCDQIGPHLIVVESLPEGSEWGALKDRLERAAAE